MITHGNKQISEIVYARKASEGGGVVRLTNIIRGAQVVFGGLYYGWLSPATKAAILAAFGQTDGKAVIKATNAYLNSIAATDPTKVQQIADFMNESAIHAVGYARFIYEYKEVEYIQGQGSQWMKIPIDFTGGISYLHIKCKKEGGGGVFSNWTSSSGYGVQLDMVNNWRFWLANDGVNKFDVKQEFGLSDTDVLDLSYSSADKLITCNGQDKAYTYGNTPPSSLNSIILFAYGINNTVNGSYIGKTRIYGFECKANSEFVIIPCYNKTSQIIGMFDVANDTFYTNSGSGTFVKGPDV